MFHMPQPGFYRGEIIPFLAAQDGWSGDALTAELVFPVDSEAGDMAIACICSEAQITPATPPGWTLRDSILHQARRYMLFTKIVEPGEPGTSDTLNMGSTVRTATATQCVRKHGGNFDLATDQSTSSNETVIQFSFNSRPPDGDLYTALVCMSGSEQAVDAFGNDVPDGRFQEIGPLGAENAATAGVVFQGTSFNPNGWPMVGNQHWRSWTCLVW